MKWRVEAEYTPENEDASFEQVVMELLACGLDDIDLEEIEDDGEEDRIAKLPRKKKSPTGGK